jgi:Spy/CpxP family protein refolding chaperone
MKKSISVLVLALLASGWSLTAQNRGNGVPEGAGEKVGKPGMGKMTELNLTDDQKAKLKVLHQQFAVQDSVSKVQQKSQREAVRAARRLEMAKILTPDQLALMDKMKADKGKKGAFQGRMQGQMQGRMGVGMQGRMQGRMGAGMQGRMQGRMGAGMQGQMRGGFQGRMNGRMGAGMHGQMRNGFQGRMQGRMMGARGMQPGGFGPQGFNKKAFAKHAGRFGKAPLVNPEIRIKNQVDRMTTLLDLTPEQAAKIQAIQERHFKKDIAQFKRAEKKRDAQFKKRHGNIDEIKAVLTPDQMKKFEAMKKQAPGMAARPMGPNGGQNAPMHGPMHGLEQGQN